LFNKCDVIMYVHCMHRTQIQLEDRQYVALKAQARREYRSLSQLIRHAVDLLLGRELTTGSKPPLSDICGIAVDPHGPSGRDHDKVLYRAK